MNSINKIKRMWEKNGPDLLAMLAGDITRQLNCAEKNNGGKQIPILCFHSVEAEGFERQLKYLKENDYISLDSEDIIDLLNGSKRENKKRVALTFDDATGSFWAIAFPLLKKYGFKAILFAIPGLVPDDARSYPSIEDVEKGFADLKEVKNREATQPLCTWAELIEMHESGVVDIQSHSFTHSRIYVSDKIVDFINPGFDSNFYGNVNIPLTMKDSVECPERKILYGQPVYEYSSRLSGKKRFYEVPEISDYMVNYVKKEGGVNFFSNRQWRKRLCTEYNKICKEHPSIGEYETSTQMASEIKRELESSKILLQEQLNGKIIHSFCYPWFQGSKIADQIAHECGYQCLYYGVINKSITTNKIPYSINRISDEYLFCLPGKGKKSLLDVYKNKISHYLGAS